jgi:hypothetical protein
MDWRVLSTDRADGRGVSPVIGVVLLAGIGVLLVAVVGVALTGFGEELEDVDPVPVYQEGRCAGSQVVEFSGDVDAFHDQLQNNPCALWLDGAHVDTNSTGAVTRWPDQGPNGYDAVQGTPGQRPSLLADPAGLDRPALAFEGDAPFRSGYSAGDDSGDTSTGIRHYGNGEYLDINRDISDLGIDDSTGLTVAAVVRAESFDRGGTWTIGKAGVDGREFSMRTCGADRTYGDCPDGSDDPTGHWRAQHWGTEDIDFESADSDGGWVLLVQAYDGEETTIYIDGQARASADTDLDLSSNRDIQIGRWVRIDDNPNFYFDGAIAELLVFDRGLSETELDDIERYFDQQYDTLDVTVSG